MTIEKDNSNTRGELREIAATWFAVMRGPDAQTRRAEFEAWLAEQPSHRAAYSRIVEAFSLGKGLKADRGTEPDRPSLAHRRLPRKLTNIAAAICLAGTLMALFRFMAPLDQAATPPRAASQQFAARAIPPTVQLATNVGEIRTYSLPDGSSATLDTDSRLIETFTPRERNLRLIRGRARFTVAHETRPFVVRAGDSAVTARGTIFDVDLTTPTRVVVGLLRGKIDVQTRRPGHALVITRLLPGDRVTVGGGFLRPVLAHSGVIDDGWPSGLRDVDRIRLADLVTAANRYATTPIVLESPDLSAMQLSGTFHLDDSTRVAENIAIVLGLAVTTTPDAIRLSQTCEGTESKNCHTPS